MRPATQAALRVEMGKAPSDSDEAGYIYAFEIRGKRSRSFEISLMCSWSSDLENPNVLHLKVGRAKTLNARLSKWDKQCGSKEQVLYGWWPEGMRRDAADLFKGRVNPGERAKFSHRLERLIQLELADLVMTRIYLRPGWPTLEMEDDDEDANSGSGFSRASVIKSMGTPCTDCRSLSTVESVLFPQFRC